MSGSHSRSASPAASSSSYVNEPASLEPTSEGKGKQATHDVNESDDAQNSEPSDRDAQGDEEQDGDNEHNIVDASGSVSQAAGSGGVAGDGSQAPSNGAWQAIFSPMHNAYYFFNSTTQETTWVNPLQVPDSSTSTPPSAPTATDPDASASAPADPSSAAKPDGPIPAHLAQLYAAQTAATAQGIDPSLAHLDPSLAGGPGGPSGAYAMQAKFNARTGAFTTADARAPEHLSEYERAKRMSSFYFDVGAWENEVAKRRLEEEEMEEDGRKKKRPSKKDLVSVVLVCAFRMGLIFVQGRYKEQKKAKKLAKTAWLRN